MARDGYAALGTLLTPEEAGMAQELLVSEGIEALLEDLSLSAVDPLVRLAIGGTKLLVPVADLERARQLLDEAGVLAPASARPAEAPEIPEAVWSAPPPPEPAASEPAPHRSPLDRALVVGVLLALATAVAHALARRGVWPFTGP